MENEITNIEQANIASTVVRSRSALFEFITKTSNDSSESEERFQSSFNPYRKTENPLWLWSRVIRTQSVPLSLLTKNSTIFDALLKR